MEVGSGRQQSAFKLNSVGAQFRAQLKGLMTTLQECQPHYVRYALSVLYEVVGEPIKRLA